MLTATLVLLPILSVPAMENAYLNMLLPRPRQVEMRKGTCPLEVMTRGVQLHGPELEACDHLRVRFGEALTRAGVEAFAPTMLGESDAYRLNVALTGSQPGKLPEGPPRRGVRAHHHAGRSCH